MDIKEVASQVAGGGKEKNNKKPLNAKQERFVIEYVKSNNAKLSAINAGYKADHAKERGYSLLQDVRIRSLIDTEKAKLKKELLKTRETFLCEVESLKKLCLEGKRIGDLVRLMALEASVLGIDKKEVASTTNNIFASVDAAKSFLLGDRGAEEQKPCLDMTDAIIVDSSPILAQTNGNEDATQDIV